MRNLWLVARREFISRGRSGAYIISTVVMMLVLFGMAVVPSYLENMGESEAPTVMVLDRTGQVTAPLKEAVQAYSEGTETPVVEVEEVEGDVENLKKETHERDASLLVIDGTYPTDLKAQYFVSKPGMMDSAGAILAPLENIIRAARIQARGVDPTVAMDVLNPIDIETSVVTASGDQQDQEQVFGSMMSGYMLVMLLYMIMLLNSSFVFQGVLEEKISRVMEVMASSVSPSQMLSGKVLGLGALGLVQLVGLAAAQLGGQALAANVTEMPQGSLNPGILALAFVYLVLGYILNATIMAAAASTISRMEDSQTMMTPITMILVLPMMFIGIVFADPNGTFATVMSLIPFFSPIMMIMRVGMTEVPMAQIVASLVLMVITTAAIMRLGARVYRAALLSYGSRPTLRQLWNYMRAG